MKEFAGDCDKSMMMTVRYFATNGDIYTAKAIWYRIQEALNELSREAYTNGTEVLKVDIF